MLSDCIEEQIQTTGELTPLLLTCTAGEEFSPVTKFTTLELYTAIKEIHLLPHLQRMRENCPKIIVIMVTLVISTALYLTDKGEHTVP